MPQRLAGQMLYFERSVDEDASAEEKEEEIEHVVGATDAGAEDHGVEFLALDGDLWKLADC